MSGEIIEHDVDLFPFGCEATTWTRKATNSSVLCRVAVFPMTCPVFVFNAAKRESVPWR